MGTPITGFDNISGKCLITNYKPDKNRERKNGDFRLFVDNGNTYAPTSLNYSAEKEDFSAVSKAIASLSGDKDKLEIEDLNKIDMLKGIHKIKNIAKDLSAGIVRLIFDDGKELRLDFEKEDEKYFDNAKWLHQFAEKIDDKYSNELCARATLGENGYENGAIAINTYDMMSIEELSYKLGVSESSLKKWNLEYLRENEDNYHVYPLEDFYIPVGEVKLPKSLFERIKELFK